MKAKVWDSLNASEDSAAEYDEYTDCLRGRKWSDTDFDAVWLAEIYAENDVDGNADGIYSGGHDIVVLFESGKRFTVTVTVDYDPVYNGEVTEQSG